MNKDYDKFLEDSSDDSPKYDEGIDIGDGIVYNNLPSNENKCGNSNDSPQCSDPLVIHPKDDESNYNEAYGVSSINRIKDSEELKIAIHNVLELAKEQTKTYLKDCVEAEKIIIDQSIKIVEGFLNDYKDSNIALAISEKKRLDKK